jgi:hypothetical protein
VFVRSLEREGTLLEVRDRKVVVRMGTTTFAVERGGSGAGGSARACSTEERRVAPPWSVRVRPRPGMTRRTDTTVELMHLARR